MPASACLAVGCLPPCVWPSTRRARRPVWLLPHLLAGRHVRLPGAPAQLQQRLRCAWQAVSALCLTHLHLHGARSRSAAASIDGSNGRLSAVTACACVRSAGSAWSCARPSLSRPVLSCRSSKRRSASCPGWMTTSRQASLAVSRAGSTRKCISEWRAACAGAALVGAPGGRWGRGLG